MEPAIYIDVVFFITWGMDSFLLWAAGRLAGYTAKKRRLAGAGFLEAILYCLWLCVFRKNGGFLLCCLLLGISLCLAYFPKQMRGWLRLFGCSLAASFLLGGSVQVLFGMTQAQRLLGRGMVIEKAYPWWLLPWSVGMAYIGLKLAARWLHAHIVRRREYCTARICRAGRKTEGRMLIDTGNGLQERGRGVAVAELSFLLPLFPREEQIQLLSGELAGLESIGFTSLGNANGRLCGIRVEQLILSYGERHIVQKDIFIGISMEGFAGAYEGIVPPCLLEEESK